MSARTPSVSAVIRLVNAPPAFRRSHAECLRRHPISECSASTPDRRRRPGSAPGPPAPARRQLGPVLRRPAPPRSPSRPSSSHPSLHGGLIPTPISESLGPGCATTWPAMRRRIALCSSLARVTFRADGCLPSGGRSRSESVILCILFMRHGRLGTINWTDRLAILTLDACHVQTLALSDALPHTTTPRRARADGLGVTLVF
jgi:hypothetical protein